MRPHRRWRFPSELPSDLTRLRHPVTGGSGSGEVVVLLTVAEVIQVIVHDKS
jgi:hypothetical protein